jgi:glucose/mannose-6-phosphate isomerase
LIDEKSLQEIDSYGMHKIYDNWPNIAKNAFNSDIEEVEFPEIDHIVFAGMGGSGSIGSIFSSILSQTNIHVSVVKGYLLPKTVDSQTLVVTTSISGNTIETLTVLKKAKEENCKIIGFSSGGKMEQYCFKNKIDFRKIPQMHSPRASFTGFLYSMLKILGPNIPKKELDILGSIEQLKILGEKINSKNISCENPAIDLANWITDIPQIYYPSGLEAAAIRFKNSLHENAKMHAMAEDIMEASHNQIVSWELPSKIIPILIQGQDDYIKTKERYNIIKEYFQTKNISYKEIYSGDGSILTKLIKLIFLLDYATIYRSVLSKIDPSPVNSIQYIKENTHS